MHRNKRLGVVTLIALALLIPGLSLSLGGIGRAQSSGVLLMGTITSGTGEKMEGVVISTRADGKTFTTSVYSDAEGNYYFPPMEPDEYKIWAQAVTYEAGRTEVTLTGSIHRADFVLRAVKDFEAQLRGDEWVASLPEETPEDRRMKTVFRMSCGGCHSENTSLLTRFDEEGWKNILTVMSRISTTGYSSSDDRAPNPLIDYYKERLAAYLAKVRGPGPSPMEFRPRPRPTGEATLMVVTEYDVPGQGYGLPLFADGTDWSEGAASKTDRQNHHAIDATLDFEGNLWFADDLNLNPYRSVGRIDWKTGVVTNFKVPMRSNPVRAVNVHDVITDHQEGMIWFGLDDNGDLGKIDPSTGEIEIFTPPEGMARADRGFEAVDGKGRIWVLSTGGAVRYDPKIREWQQFPNPIEKSKLGRTSTYGMAADRDGNGWWSMFSLDLMIKADSDSGRTESLKMPPVTGIDEELFTGDDRRILDMMGGSLYQGRGLPSMQTIRKPGADRWGDVVWGPAWIGDNLIKIDIHTHEVTVYPYPWKHVGGYQAAVDEDGMVWIDYTNADAVARFNPRNETWTVYELPTIGTESHGIQVTTVRGRTQVIVPYWGSSKVAKLEVRTREELSALRVEAQERMRDQ